MVRLVVGCSGGALRDRAVAPRTSAARPTTDNESDIDMNRRTANQRGFTLIELIVVVTIIGILAGIALVNVKGAQRKAAEAALKEDLHTLRKGIDDYYADKQKYPASLQDLVPHYLRKIPVDPITKTPDWEEIQENPSDPLAPPDTGGSSDTNSPAGIIDVKSKAQGNTLDNVPYREL
jgi:general secretion pathway protein G